MTEEEIIKEVRDLRERVEDLEDEREAIKELPQAVSELHGAVGVLQSMITSRFDGIEPKVDKAASFKTAIQFAAVVVVPVIVALIGGYFALKAGLASSASTK